MNAAPKRKVSRECTAQFDTKAFTLNLSVEYNRSRPKLQNTGAGAESETILLIFIHVGSNILPSGSRPGF
jgi:hypothetical protein